MSIDNTPELGFASLAVRAGQQRTFEGEHAEPIFLTSSFVFANAAEAAARFSGAVAGNIYSRFTNPTVRVFQERLAALEGGEACIATSSGMAAILATCMALLKSGDHIVSANAFSAAPISLFNQVPEQVRHRHQLRLLVRPHRMGSRDPPGNPAVLSGNPVQSADGAGRYPGAGRSRSCPRCLLVVDNCFCTPALQQPFKLGADLVIHSGTKYLDGQGRCVGGAVIGDQQRVGVDIFGFLRTAGPTLSPFNAWVFLKGLETLKLRMRAHSEAALHLARWLETQPAVERVYYPGLPSHPQHELAKRQQSGFGGIVSFDLRGGREAAWTLIDATRLISITANLGDAKSTITHPATTTHGRLTPQEREAAGIGEGLVRISVGLEEVADFQRDLERGFRLLG